MAVNIVRKSKNEDEEEKRKQLLAQMQENSQARKNAEIQAVKNSNVKFNNPYVGGGTYLAGKYVSGLGEGTTNIVSAPMQTLALGFQQGSKQASKEQTTWDKIKNIGKNTFKTFAYADPTMITRLMYDTTVGRDEFVQNANEVNTQIQQNASQADSTWKKATAYLGGYGSYIQKQYLNSGLNQLQTGAQSVGQVLGSEKSQQASQALLEADDKLHEPIDKLNEELSKSEGAQNKVIRRLGNASYTIGNMTPSILISALSGGAGASDATREALSLTSMGISAKGGSTREGLKQGLDLSTAERIGVSKGMVEVGTEKMWNGLSFLKSPDSKVGSAIRTWIGKQVEDRIKSQFGKTVLTKWIPDLAGETLEEFVSGIYDNWLDRATVDPNRGNFFKEQSLDTLIDTTLSTLLMNAPSYVLETKAIHDRNKSGNQTNANTEESNGYKQNLQEMVNNLDIPNEMKAELQQTIDSNETITGEEYNNTKERIKSLVKQNTQQQIDSLSNDLNNQYIDINNRLSELDNIKAENFKDPESRRFYAQQINKEFGDTTLDSILAGYPENRNGNRTVKQYKEIAKEYGKQMAENGLTFDEVRANTVGAWQYYEPNKNITRYDNKEHKNASFDRLNSQVWSEEVYNSYKDTMRTQLQQQQEALSTQMNEELTRLQDEENILIDTIDRLGTQETETTRERDINSVNDRVQNYIDKNNLDMTVEEFKKWAQERQLENEDITDENQRELYDLISDVQNIVYKDEIKNQEKQTKKKLTLDSIKEKYKNNVDVLNINENGDYISLGNLVVKENQRNKGIGQKILNDLIQYADENNKTITLTPTSEFNTKNKLKQWYKNNGFVENKGKNTDFLINDTMYKRPVQQSNKLESQQGSFNLPKNIEIDGTEYEVRGKETSPYQRKTQKEWNIDSIQEQLKKEQSPTTSIKAELDKFDSFDEMKDNIYYHGSIGYNQNLKAGSTLREDQRTGGYGEAYHTISLSKNRNLASNFASMGSTGVVTPVLLRKDARVIKMDNVSDSIELEDYLPELWKNNIDAVELGEGSEEELVVLNPNAITVIGKGRTDFKNYGKPKFQNLNAEDLEAIYQEYKDQEVSELKEKINNETNETKKETLRKELETLQKKSVQDIGTDNATYDTNTISTHEQLREFKDQVENEINSRYGDNSAKIYISAPASGFIIEVDNKISGEEFKQRLDTTDSKELFKQIRPILSELTQEAGFDVNNIINPGNQTTENLDIRYEQADIQEDNTEMNEWQRKVNQSMTMEEAKTMIEKAFNTQKDFVDFDNAEDWLRNDPGEVGMIIENTESLIYQYINSNQDILNEEYTIDDVIDAYMEGTLTGKSKVPTTRLDISKQNNYVDNKFYAPKDIQGGKELYETANQRVTKTNSQEVYRARGNFIINAHQQGYVESIGLTQEEANKKIKQWANYSEKTMKLSNEINKDASTQNRWTGLENSSIVNTIGISNEELNSMVKGIEGANEEWQRRYITSAFLAIDTHIDYSDLSFVFEENSNKSYLGLYDGSKKTIYISPDYRAGQNTVAHEIGHYLDEKWGKQLFGYTNGLMNLSQQGDFEGLTEEQKQFVINFRNFAEDIQNTSDMRSNYTMTPTEVFARFVGRFTEWTKNQATSNRYGYEEKYYKDNFTERQYIEFAKLLQEKALLDTTTEYANIDKVKNQKGLVTEEKISDIFDDLNKRKKLPTKQTQTISSTIEEPTLKVPVPKGNTGTEQKVAKVLSEPITKVKPEQRAWALFKANILDKGAVFEDLSFKAKNRELQAKWDSTLLAEAKGQNAIGQARYEFENGEEKQVSKALTDIIDEVGENSEDFNNYMYHQLNIDRMTLEDRFDIANKPVFGDGIDANYSKQKVAELEKAHPEFKEYAQDVYDYLDTNKKELVDNGVISQETSDKFKEMYPHYVPIARIDAKGQAINVPLDTNRTGVNSPIKRAKGGSQDIQPLFQTIADRTMQTYKASSRNSFGLELKNTLDNLGMFNQLETTTENADNENLFEYDGEKGNLTEGTKYQNPTFTVFENGEKVTYEINQDMYDALRPKNEIFSKWDNTKLMKATRKLNDIRRGILTEYNPAFSITNAIKDAQDVLMNSQHAGKTYAKFGEAYSQILKKGYWYKEYVQNGGSQNSYFTDGDFVKQDSKVKSIIKMPLEAISNVNNVIEMAPRLAEYIASREQGKSVQSAMLDASRVTTNFKAGGDVTKFANRNGATFLNASVQGLQQNIRNIREANAKGLKGYGVLLGKAVIAGLPALILNNLVWKDDEDYEELQDYVKDNYYIIAKIGDHKFLRIPKGRTVAVIQKAVTNMSDFITNKDEIDSDKYSEVIWGDLKDTFELASNNLAPNNPIENNIVSPIVQAVNNKTWYGEDLVPSRLKDKPNEEKYDESTAEISKQISGVLNKIGINTNPMQINYLLDQYGGGVADVLLPMGTPQAENNMIEDKFTTDSVMKSRYPGEFFELKDKLAVNRNSSKATDEDELLYKYANNVSGELSDLYQKKREIQNSSLTDKEKKKQIAEVQKQINSKTQQALKDIKEPKVSGDTATIGNSEYIKTLNANSGEYQWNKLTDKTRIQGVSLKTQADYQNRLAKYKQKTGDSQLSDKEEAQIILDGNYSSKDKKAIYIATVGKKDTLYKSVSDNLNIDEYLNYKTANIQGVKDSNGKTISGTKKTAQLDYINNNISGYENRLLLMGKDYKLSRSQQQDLAQYIYSQDNAEELFELFDKNFTVREGTVYYK